MTGLKSVAIIALVLLGFVGCTERVSADTAKPQAADGVRAGASPSALPKGAAANNGAKQISSGDTIKTDQDGINVGLPVHHDNLVVFPLLGSAPAGETHAFTPLDVAMDARQLTVTEQGDGGSVPALRVSNQSKEMVFVMTGEIVTGANQDRMSAHDVLLPPQGRAIKLPVYCVERGRWQGTSQRFSAGKTAGTTTLRKSAAKKASQGTIWAKVAQKSGAASVHSATGTMQAVYNSEEVKQKIAVYEQALWRLAADQRQMVGVVAAINGEIVSADLFADHALLSALWPKLLKALAIDAITAPPTAHREAPTRAAVSAFFNAGRGGTLNSTENPGLGNEYLIEAANGVTGTELMFDNRIVHLSLFGPDREEGTRAFIPVQSSGSVPRERPLQRRRGYSKRRSSVRWNNTGAVSQSLPQLLQQ